MTSPTPSPAVPEALRLAEELRDACMKIRVKASLSLSTLIPIMQKSADALAALVQPPEAPMDSVLQRVMARLAGMLDDDKFKDIETIVEAGGFSAPEAPAGWRPLEDAPEGVRILLGPRDAPVAGFVSQPSHCEEEVSCSVVHYNGNVLVAGYHCKEWRHIDAPAAIAPAAVEVSRLIQDARELVDRGLPKWSLTRRSVMEKLDEISLATMAPAPASDSAAETALRMAVERHMTCRFYFGSTVAQATVPGGPAVYETVENHADPLIGACQAIAQAAAKIDAGTPAPQVPLEAARQTSGVHDFAGQSSVEESLAALVADQRSRGGSRLVGGEAADSQWQLVRDALSDFRLVDWADGDGEQLPLTDLLCHKGDTSIERGAIVLNMLCDDIMAALSATQAAPTDAPGEPDMRLRNLQTWLVCREIGNALAPSLETVQGWLAALGDITGVAPPDFVMKAPKRDNSRCKFAAGGACCSSHCGDPACLASAPPTATDAQGVGEAPKAVAWCKLTANGQIAYFDGKPMVMPGPVGNDCHPTPLYTHPTASTTAGLTEAAMLTQDEVFAVAIYTAIPGSASNVLGFAIAIQRACAEKWNVRLDGGAAK